MFCNKQINNMDIYVCAYVRLSQYYLVRKQIHTQKKKEFEIAS
jgi:hypothetical protein